MMQFRLKANSNSYALIVSIVLQLMHGLNSHCNSLASAAKLNSDGGYEITLAIQTDQDLANSVGYLANVKNTLISFSSRLYLSTKSKNGGFYIKRAEILVPASWDIAPADNAVSATTQSFRTADLRVSDKFLDPYTENPNLCGITGSHIELPLTFFEKLNETPFGRQVKVLVTQWARYRYGVWDEHGFPSSTRFPYFYRDSQRGVWEATGCSDRLLIGNYVDKYNEINEQCSIDREEPLRSDCRFQPSNFRNDASTSLMHFHWLDSVTNFCDETTHNRDAPNRQNLFCGYKSVWEVIRETADYKAVTQEIEDVPLTQFQISKELGTPVLYVLVDKGETQLPSVVRKVNTWVSRLFDEPTPGTTLAAVGTFPGDSSTRRGNVIERVQWSTVSSSRAAFQGAVELPSNGDSGRDFGRAIIEAAEIIKRKSSPSGAVLLIVKTGAGENSFGDLAYEKEVFSALTSEKIKVYGLELRGETSKPYLNMASLLESLNGVLTVVTPSTVDDPTLFEGLLSNIRTVLSTPIADEIATETNIFRALVAEGQLTTILVRPNLTRMNFYLTAPAAADILISTSAGTVVEHGVPEWDEMSDGERRFTYPGYFLPSAEQELNGGEWKIMFTCTDNCRSIRAHLFVNGVHADDPSNKVPDVQVFTSAMDRIVDLNVTKDFPSPFTIFARVRLNHQPVAGLKIQASIAPMNGDSIHTVTLVDDGLGHPDIDCEDGIYSGTYVPDEDGTYRIALQIKNHEISEPAVVPRIDTRLLPIDQTQFGCPEDEDDEGSDDGCGAVRLEKVYQTSIDVVDTITFVNRGAFVTGKPGRILELDVPETSYGEILLSFVTPSAGTAGTVHLGYNVYIAKERDLLLDHRDNPTLVDLEIVYGTKQPGEREELHVRSNRYHEVVWIGIVVFNQNDTSMTSELSALRTTNLLEAFSTSTGPTDDPVTGDDPIDESTTSSETPSSTQESGPDSDGKSFWKKTEGIVTIVAIVIVVVALLTGGVWFCKKRSQSSNMSTA